MHWTMTTIARMTCSCVTLGALVFVVGCSRSTAPPAGSAPASASSPASGGEEGDEPLPDVPSPYAALPEDVRGLLETTFTGDLDEIVKRRLIRAGVVFNRTQYFIDRGVQRGISYESITLFDEQLNKRLKTGPLKVHAAFVPMSRDQLFPALAAGKVDFVAAALTITPERRKLVDFSTPTRTGVSEIAVTAPDVQGPTSVEDLSGREVFVRKSSSYYESLQQLNQSLASQGKAPVTIKDAPDALEDDDILEMVNAGLVDITIVDDFVAELWQKVFTNVQSPP